MKAADPERGLENVKIGKEASLCAHLQPGPGSPNGRYSLLGPMFSSS